ncbi:DUF1127 domain-containing protein [Marinovum sp.]|uniref:DUF1127 domain-containing protein n=1 Tax=Marinovum sp. TaxID=2024839 RepID=UPI002B265478|nr:DUF1127 domain-containing protein [Marinovum sp.]
MAYASSNTASGFSFSALLHKSVEAYKTARTRRAVYNRTFDELASLTDRDLADIGVARSNIRAIALKEAALVR